MSDLTVKQVRQLIAEAEMRIFGILNDLQRKTGLTVADVAPQLVWYDDRDEEEVFDENKLIRQWSELKNIKIEMNWG